MLTPPDLQTYIDQAHIEATLVPMALETPTVPAAAAALGVEPAQIVKTLLFLVRGEPLLVIASGATLVDRRPLAGRYDVGKKQIRLAEPETVLRLTGYPVGGVPPLGHPAPIPALLDEAIRAWTVVYGGGGDDHTLLRITVDELARVTEGEWLAVGDGRRITEGTP